MAEQWTAEVPTDRLASIAGSRGGGAFPAAAHQYCPPQPNWSLRHCCSILHTPMREPVASPLNAYPLLSGLSVRLGWVMYSLNSADSRIWWRYWCPDNREMAAKGQRLLMPGQCRCMGGN